METCFHLNMWSHACPIRDAGNRHNKSRHLKSCKVTGNSFDTASWVTNVANERGGIFQSVVTTSESSLILKNS